MATNDNWPVIAGIDTTQARLVTGDDLDLHVELLHMFIAGDTEIVKKIAMLLRTGGSTEASMLAHKLRGLAGNIGATAVCVAAGGVEKAINEHATNIDLFLVELQKHYATLVLGLQQWSTAKSGWGT